MQDAAWAAGSSAGCLPAVVGRLGPLRCWLQIVLLLAVQDPYFNEPNVELMRGTSEGIITSMR